MAVQKESTQCCNIYVGPREVNIFFRLSEGQTVSQYSLLPKEKVLIAKTEQFEDTCILCS
jgi:hypothetical protein